MTGESNKRGFYQGAMYYGTILGAMWSVMYILMFIGVSNPLLLLGCMGLFVGSPFFAAMLARKYRREECCDMMKYMQAWGFIYCMYICASLLSALVIYLYLNYVDNGMFFAAIQEMLKISLELPGVDDVLRQQINETSKMIADTTASDFVWQIMSNNILNASVLPFIIAIFVRRNNNIQ